MRHRVHLGMSNALSRLGLTDSGANHSDANGLFLVHLLLTRLAKKDVDETMLSVTILAI